MSNNPLCPFCDSPLVCQVSQGKPYWFCRNCHQQVPYGFCEDENYSKDQLIPWVNDSQQPGSLTQYSDKLTNLANYNQFKLYIRQEWQRTSREKRPLSLILSNIHFSVDFEQTYGTLLREKYWQQIVNIVKSSARRPADFVAHYRVEQLAIILPNTELFGAVKVAENIRNQLLKLKIINGEEEDQQKFIFSLGVATMKPQYQIAVENLIIKAERALAQAQFQGDNCLFCAPINNNFLEQIDRELG